MEQKPKKADTEVDHCANVHVRLSIFESYTRYLGLRAMTLTTPERAECINSELQRLVVSVNKKVEQESSMAMPDMKRCYKPLNRAEERCKAIEASMVPDTHAHMGSQ